MSENTSPIALFDFDGTLTTGDTLMPFLQFVVGKPRYYWKLFLVSPILIGYSLKLIPNYVAKEAVLKRYLAGFPIDELFTLGKNFSEAVIPTMLRPEGMEQLKKHQDQGHECILVSASLNIYLQSWSAKNGFEQAITTSLDVKNGVVTGSIQGKNCHGEEKLTRVLSALPNFKARESYAYGDAISDIPLLTAASYGYLYKGKGFLLQGTL